MTHEEALNIFQTFLKAKGQRLTNERKIILDAVFNSDRHFCAETLVNELRKKRRRVSLATVYRTLPVLVESGFLESTVKQGDVEFYERKRGADQHHDHLLCVSCGRIVEFFNPQIEEEQEKVARLFGYVLSGHRLELRGKCGDCQIKASPESSLGIANQSQQ